VKVELEVEIEAVGARGDGIATLADGKRLYVPYTVPGDRARVRLGQPRPDGYAARVTALLAEGPGRAAPPCPHFGLCGGCALQHLAPERYAAWKLELLGAALQRQDVAAGAVRVLETTPPASRRRAEFTAIRRKDDLLLGFNARLSHQVVDLAECPVLRPEIVALLPTLRALLAELLAPAESAEIVATLTDSGIDLLLVSGASIGLKRSERLAAFAEAQDLARLSRRHPRSRGTEALVERRPVRVRFGDASAAIPPGAFLQASAEGEAALRRAVIEAVGPARRVFDLFAGCGTFALPLGAGGRRVQAVEADRALAASLAAAARESGGRIAVAVEARDLERRPLQPEELAGAEAVVLDPPRAGARAQCEALARSAVPRLAMVSCNPASFARDARILLDGGYRLEWIQPVDQFLWSPHLELVGCFGTSARGRGRRR
jgi:23S rRNA (uracil1939-C5)-methyltransferase